MSELNRAFNVLRGYIGREWERIADLERDAAARELDGPAMPPAERKPYEYKSATEAMDAEKARRVLGVTEQATMEEIEAAYKRLAQRIELDKFPLDSPEMQMAQAIHRRIHRAYTILIEEMTITEKRFRSLEI